jgi:hypothetical protein
MSDAAPPVPARPPSPPHDVPAAADLVAAVAEFLGDRVLPAVDGELRYLVLVSVNALGVVERELAAGDGPSRRHAARLHELGCADDAELAAKSRDGSIDAADPVALAAVRAAVRDKLAIADPRLLPGGAPGSR